MDIKKAQSNGLSLNNLSIALFSLAARIRRSHRKQTISIVRAAAYLKTFVAVIQFAELNTRFVLPTVSGKEFDSQTVKTTAAADRVKDVFIDTRSCRSRIAITNVNPRKCRAGCDRRRAVRHCRGNGKNFTRNRISGPSRRINIEFGRRHSGVRRHNQNRHKQSQ